MVGMKNTALALRQGGDGCDQSRPPETMIKTNFKDFAQGIQDSSPWAKHARHALWLAQQRGHWIAFCVDGYHVVAPDDWERFRGVYNQVIKLVR